MTPPTPASDAEIANLRELLAKATPGPWKWHADDWSMLSLFGPGE